MAGAPAGPTPSPVRPAGPLGRLREVLVGGAPDYVFSRWVFLRGLGVVYLAAFLSLWVQIQGLIGSRGVLPVGEYLEAVRGLTGPERYCLVPTLCWLDPTDDFLHGQCAAGVVLSGLLILGVAPALVLFLLWLLYLSLTVAGQEFLGFQWDALLLETGLLAVFFAPWRLWPRLATVAPPPRLALWLLRWLLFRLMFSSGMVKLMSGDPTWRDWTALSYHYETQPLPPWTSWYMQQLPAGFQSLSVGVTFLIELVLPFLVFGPRRLRLVAFVGLVGLQLLIAATGNYGFFNLLSVVLCIPLLDDRSFPARWRPAPRPPADAGLARARWLLVPVSVAILVVSVPELLQACGVGWRGPGWLVEVRRAVAPFRSVNSYGLFAVMTTRRPEIILEGSDDGRTWQPYEFRWKPGDVRRRPAFTGLHMPRLDWQMWFAALGDWRENPWLVRLLFRLEEGSPDVLALLGHNPFPDRPPRCLRAVVYQYHFTDAAARRETGAWWRRQEDGLYCPVLSAREKG